MILKNLSKGDKFYMLCICIWIVYLFLGIYCLGDLKNLSKGDNFKIGGKIM